MGRIFVFCAAAALLLIASSHAARPFATDDAGTVEQGRFELETTADYWSRDATLSMGMKYGLADRIDIGATFAYTPFPRELRQISGLECGLKYALIPDLLSASLNASFTDLVYGANLILSRSLNAFSVHGNVGIEAAPSQKSALLTYGIAATVTTGIVTSGIEVGGSHQSLSRWQAGAQVELTPWMALDGGIGGDFDNPVGLVATTGLWFTF